MRLMGMAAPGIGTSSGTSCVTRSGRLARGLYGTGIGMVIALGTLGFFSLLENWPGLLSLTWRPVLGVGCIFGWLAGALSTAADSTDQSRETFSGQA